MDPVTVPTSFIPKRPVASENVISQAPRRAVGLLSILATVAVLATIASFVGVYLFESQLAGQKTKLQSSITSAKDGLGTDFVSDMKRLNNRIEGVKSLIKSHVVVSPIFEALQSTTLQSVQYSDFSYDYIIDATNKVEVVEVKLSGNAKSYATIALQSDAYTKSSLIRNPVFSNLTINDETGRIGFNLTFNVNPTDLGYQAFIDSKNKITTPAPATQTPAPVVAPDSAPVNQQAPANPATL